MYFGFLLIFNLFFSLCQQIIFTRRACLRQFTGQFSVQAITTNKLAIDNKFKISVGLFAGYERERNVPDALYTPLGIVSQLDFESKFWGINSKLYTGEPRMRMYSKFSNNLYWGNPLLQSGFYLENKLYVKIINSKYVQGKIAYQLHVSENKVFHEQVFTLNASIDKLLFSFK